MPTPFTKAVRSQARARIALMGPSGSGKTYTALVAASTLGKRIGVIDTERGSAALYADRFTFEFDTCALQTFAPQTYVDAIHAAEDAGYDVIVIDSLTHAWTGKGGALEMVEQATARSKSSNSFAAWREVTPAHNALVDAMLQSPCHIVATMRTKTEYVLEEDDRGRKVPRKIGMAPIQRDGLEYEFTVVGDMDHMHRLVITKSRYADIADAVVTKPDQAWFQQIVKWLSGATPANGSEEVKSKSPEPPRTEPMATREDAMRLNLLAKGAGYDAKRLAALLKESYLVDRIADMTKAQVAEAIHIFDGPAADRHTTQ